jgi:hypothetical protein
MSESTGTDQSYKDTLKLEKAKTKVLKTALKEERKFKDSL